MKAYPTSSTHWANLAMAYRAQRQRPKAEEALKKALALDPANAHAKQASQALRREAGGPPE